MTIDTQPYKEMLLKEAETIETQLQSVGRKNLPDVDRDRADETEVADNLEDAETNNVIVSQLEKQLTDVKDALAKIEAGNYGICEISGEEIEEDRLMANPSARTCKMHMNG